MREKNGVPKEKLLLCKMIRDRRMRRVPKRKRERPARDVFSRYVARRQNLPANTIEVAVSLIDVGDARAGTSLTP